MQSALTLLSRPGISRLFLSICLLVISGTAQATDFIATASGQWSSPTTWNGIAVPASTDVAIIPAGITVTINNSGPTPLNFSNPTSIEVFGSLILAGNDDINFVSPVIIHVFSGGTMTDNTINASYYFEPGSVLYVYSGATYALGTLPTAEALGSSLIFYTTDPTGNTLGNSYSLTPQSGPFTVTATSTGGGQITFANSTPTTVPAITSNPVNHSACSIAGGPVTTFGVAASGSPYCYIWQVSTNGGSSWSDISSTGNYANPNTATLSISNPPTSFNDYKYRCLVINNSGLSTTGAAVLTFASQGQWLGASSDSWSNPANWGCDEVPSPTVNVSISAGVPNMPVIDETIDACDNLSINAGASLAFAGTANALHISGSLTNNGSFSTASGTIILAGSGAAVPALTYNNLQIDGSGNHLVSTPLTVNGTLTLTSGTVDLGNNDLTIAATGSIAGGSAASYVITDGSGALLQQNIGTGGITGTINFPIGTATSYTPLALTNTGMADTYGARVIPAIYSAYTATDAPSGTAQTVDNVNNTWLVTEGVAGGSNVTLGFQWNASDEQTSFTRNSCFASHYTGGAWVPGPLNQTATGSGPYSLALSGITSFSPFGVGSTGSILPLQLVSFTGTLNARTVNLGWTTDQEQNLASFGVERSLDGGATYTLIGTVAAIGNTTTAHTYQYVDASLPAAANEGLEYRLVMTDINGNFRYSTIVTITLTSGPDAYHIYPNPVKGGWLYVQATPGSSSQKDVLASIVDLSGHILLTTLIKAQALQTGQVTVDVSTIPPGFYVLQLNEGNGGLKRTYKFNRM